MGRREAHMKDELITRITFTDRGLDTRGIRDDETVRTDSRGVHVSQHGSTTLYPWTSIFSVQYRETV